jgi:hypothetical protein
LPLTKVSAFRKSRHVRTCAYPTGCVQEGCDSGSGC